MWKTISLIGMFLILSGGCFSEGSGDTVDPVSTDTEVETKPNNDEKPKPRKSKTKKKNKHLTLSKVEPLFLKDLSGFALDGVKQKEKDRTWVEFSATYQDEEKNKIKVVVNDVPPRGSKDWKPLFKDFGVDDIKGNEAAFEEKGDKITLMVRVGKRFRVDFKSRDVKRKKLEKMAKNFNFQQLKKMVK